MTVSRYVGFGATIPGSQVAIPDNYHRNHIRATMGEGKPVFKAVTAAIMQKQGVDLGWVTLQGTVAPDAELVMLAKVLGTRWHLPLQVVDVYETELSGTVIAGFSYATRPGHMLRGEERFCAEWDLQSNRVTYEIFSFSQPDRFLARVGWPYIVSLQKSFLNASVNAIQQAIR